MAFSREKWAQRFGGSAIECIGKGLEWRGARMKGPISGRQEGGRKRRFHSRRKKLRRKTGATRLLKRSDM